MIGWTVFKGDAWDRIGVLADEMRWKVSTAAGAMAVLWRKSQSRGAVVATAADLCFWAQVDPAEAAEFIEKLQTARLISPAGGDQFTIHGNQQELEAKKEISRKQSLRAQKRWADERAANEALEAEIAKMNAAGIAGGNATGNAAGIAGGNATGNAAGMPAAMHLTGPDRTGPNLTPPIVPLLDFGATEREAATIGSAAAVEILARASRGLSAEQAEAEVSREAWWLMRARFRSWRDFEAEYRNNMRNAPGFHAATVNDFKATAKVTQASANRARAGPIKTKGSATTQQQ